MLVHCSRSSLLRARPRGGGLASTFAVGLLLWGVPLMLVAGFPVTAIVVPLLLLVGVGNTLVDVSGITLLQRSAPDAVLGRVFGAFESVIIGSLGIGALLAPALDAAFGPRGALLVAGAILPVVLLPSWRRRRARPHARGRSVLRRDCARAGRPPHGRDPCAHRPRPRHARAGRLRGTLSRHAASAEAVGSIVAARLPSPVIS